MMRVGLTGSIASGKSEAAKYLRARGIAVFDADEAVHNIYADRDLSKPIADEFPSALRDGKINRQLLSAHLLEHPKDFSKLEQLVHPLVRKQREDFLGDHRSDAVVVLDIPLLFETGEDKHMDCTVAIVTTDNNQRQRALARSGMTEEKLSRIRARQMPSHEKAAKADFVIENNGTIADLHQAMDHVIAKLKVRAKHQS